MVVNEYPQEYLIGWYLEEHYRGKLRVIERRLFHCLKKKSSKWIKKHFPICFNLCGWEYSNIYDEEKRLYWLLVIEEFKIEYPEILMEAYLLGDK